MSENNQALFQTIKQAVKTTGLSEYCLRQRLRAGNIPHITSGNKILINMPRFLEILEKETVNSAVEK